jgi:hypothetical protein
MKNQMSDLNDHLFMQMERLGDEGKTPEEIELECRRAVAMVGVADQILRHASLQIQAAKMITDHSGVDPTPYLPKLGGKTAAALVIEGRKQ